MADWADFLDLQASGPLPWLKEIEEGIAHCSKFVPFVDNAWLTSYNCLQVVPGQPMSVRVMHELFSGMSSINLCDCGIHDGALGSEED
eukprot:jgi/Tetstr1/429193/TSEL_019146.t1